MSLYGMPAAIGAFASSLVQRGHAVWIIGSQVNDTATRDSDWDLLIFGNEALLIELEAVEHIPTCDPMVVYNNGELFRKPWTASGKGGRSFVKWAWQELSGCEARYQGTKSPDDWGSAKRAIKFLPLTCAKTLSTVDAFSTKYGSIRGSQPSVSERHPKLGKKIHQLGQLSDKQYDFVKQFLARGDPYSVDLLLVSLVSRSLEVTDAFVHAYDRWNISVASSLVRLQIDNVLRVFLFASTGENESILAHLVDDKPLRRYSVPLDLVDRLPKRFGNKPKCTDDALLELASQSHDWIRDAYNSASGWVHHSAAHVLTTWRAKGGGTITARIPVDIEQFDLRFIEPIIDTMGVASRTLSDYLQEWARLKQARGTDE